MADQRIKGQEVTVSLSDPDGGSDSIGDVSNFESETLLEILEEDYLGETTTRTDEIYNGESGRMDLHLEQEEWWRLQQKIVDRARRRAAAAGVFNITAAFAFPNGRRVRLTYENVHFGGQPIRVSDRKSYVTVTLAWRCSGIRRVF